MLLKFNNTNLTNDDLILSARKYVNELLLDQQTKLTRQTAAYQLTIRDR